MVKYSDSLCYFFEMRSTLMIPAVTMLSNYKTEFLALNSVYLLAAASPVYSLFQYNQHFRFLIVRKDRTYVSMLETLP